MQKMFCNQCQEAARGVACEIKGTCGKSPELARELDSLVHGVCHLAYEICQVAREELAPVWLQAAVNHVRLALFASITNANWSMSVIAGMQAKTGELLKQHLQNFSRNNTLSWNELDAAQREQAAIAIVSSRIARRRDNPDICALEDLILYGLKGMAAYAKHAAVLGYEDSEIDYFMLQAMAVLQAQDKSLPELIELALQCGKYGVQVMEVLDRANTSTYGIPQISEVKIGVGTRPGILVSGHDLADLAALLEQSKNSGIDIYTHGEMLPAHYYPHFKQYEHFYGNYGNAWWQQVDEFRKFNGPILLTTNCLIPPRNPEVAARIYTTGAVACDGCKHIDNPAPGQSKDFSAIIAQAQQCLPPQQIEQGTLIGGFAHQQVMQLAPSILEAIAAGKIRKFIVMAGCDGRMHERSYYSEFAQKLPKDCVILTAGCAKYRYNKLPLGDIDGIPRVLDAGQCNDSYSLAVIALRLQQALGLENINDLPISYNIAWYEQKAVIVLLALLHLGVKNIHLGPTLPAFISPNVLKVLVEEFQLGGIAEVDADLAKMA